MTLYISQASAIRYANVALANRDIKAFRVQPVTRRNPDTRHMERGYAVEIVDTFANHRGWM
jgi:hypothetical protein